MNVTRGVSASDNSRSPSIYTSHPNPVYFNTSSLTCFLKILSICTVERRTIEFSEIPMEIHRLKGIFFYLKSSSGSNKWRRVEVAGNNSLIETVGMKFKQRTKLTVIDRAGPKAALKRSELAFSWYYI